MTGWVVSSGGYRGYVSGETVDDAFKAFLDQQAPKRLGLIASFVDIADQDPENVLYASTERMLPFFGLCRPRCAGLS